MPIHPPLISSDAILAGELSAAEVRSLDQHFGNTDLIVAMTALDIAGPFTVVSPWELADERGVRRINATGYAALPFGERSPALVHFVQEYLERDRSMDLPQQAAAPWRAALQHNLVVLLSALAPAYADAQVLPANSGAEAVENAVKLARAARPHASFVITFSGAYHGLTAMALSLTPNADYQDLFRPLVPDVVTVPYGNAEALRAVIGELGAAQVVAIILEPIQGEAGVIRPPATFLQEVGSIGAATGILIIADEIQSGLGRTGHWFESIAQGLEPDIITLAKPLGGGLIPIGVTIARAGLADRAVGGLGCGRLASTFAGNSLAAAIAVKSLELLVEGDIPARAQRLGAWGLGRLQEIQARYPDLLTAVRGAGLLFALEFASVVPAGWPGSHSEVVGELSSILGLHLLHDAGVQACLAMNDKRTVRLTPALDMPEELFTELWRRVEQAAASSSAAWKLLLHTPLHTWADLTGLLRRTTVA